MKIPEIVISLIIVAVAAYLLKQSIVVHKAGPFTVTNSRMAILKERILSHATTHNQLPTDLAELHLDRAEQKLLRDGWGNDIQYQLLDESRFQLASHLEYPTDFGEGPVTNFIWQFVARDAEGNWKSAVETWDQHPHSKAETNATAHGF